MPSYAKVPKHSDLIFNKDTLVVYKLENGKPGDEMGTYDKETKAFIPVEIEKPVDDNSVFDDNDETDNEDDEPVDETKSDDVEKVVETHETNEAETEETGETCQELNKLSIPIVTKFLNKFEADFEEEKKMLLFEIENMKNEKLAVEEKYEKLKSKFKILMGEL